MTYAPNEDELRAAYDEQDRLRDELATARRDLDLARARVAELERERDEWAQKDGNSPGYNKEKAQTYGRIAHEERERAERAEAQVATLREALDELADIVQGHLDDGDKLDSFTLRPARAALAATEPKGGAT